MLGTTFANYTVLERLNRGGLADIYLVADANERRFALRVLLSGSRDNWTTGRRFNWSCEVARQLSHPNVVRWIEDGKFRGNRFCIFEYIDGPNLKECILRNDPQLRANLKKLLLGMAAGLVYVHKAGFLHLDFKPENVVVSRAYDPKIIDFDLAIPRPDQPRKVAKLSGTPTYLAPEQIMRQPVDERADIFAFGITAYEMLTSKKPVIGDTIEEVMRKYANFDQHLKPLRDYLPTVPPAIERVVLKCLEKDISRRYPSMSLVVRDLQI